MAFENETAQGAQDAMSAPNLPQAPAAPPSLLNPRAAWAPPVQQVGPTAAPSAENPPAALTPSPAAQDEDENDSPVTDAVAKAFLGSVAERKGAAPGGFSDKLQGALESIQSTLGQTAQQVQAGSSGKPSFMKGFEGAIAAKETQRQQKIKDDMLIARNQIETMRAQRDLDRMDREDRQVGYAANGKFVDALRDKHEVEEGVTQEEYERRLKANPQYLTTHYAQAVGELPVLDGSGKPVRNANGGIETKPVYSIVSRDTKTGQDTAHVVTQDEHDYFAKYLGPKAAPPVGTSLDPDKFKNLFATAAPMETALKAIQKSRADDLHEDQVNQIRGLLLDPHMQHYMSNPAGPLAGLHDAYTRGGNALNDINTEIGKLQQIQQHPDMDPKIAQGAGTHIQLLKQQADAIQQDQQKISRLMEQGFDESAKDKYQSQVEREQQLAEIKRHNLAEEVLKARELGVNGQGSAGSAFPMGADAAQTKQRLAASNPAAIPVLNRYSTSDQEKLLDVAFGNGDVPFNEVFPARPYGKNFHGLTAQDAVAALHEINPNWTPQQYKIKGDAYRKLVKQNKNQIDQYNNSLQHMANAVDVFSQYQGNNKIWNAARNNWNDVVGKPEAARLEAAIKPVRDEVELLLSGGYKPGEREKEAFDKVLGKDSSLAQISAAFQELADVGAVRLNSINRDYMRATGNNIPSLLFNETLDAARKLGLENAKPQAWATLNSFDRGGTMFGGQTPETSIQPREANGRQQDEEGNWWWVNGQGQAIKRAPAPQQ